MGCESSLNNQTLMDKQLKQQDFKLAYRQFIMNSRGEIFDFYHFSTIVHRSSISVIRRVYHRSNKAQRVCKIIAVENLRQLSCVQEVEILKSIQHPHAIKVYEYFIEKHFVYMIFQSIKGPTLQQALFSFKELPFGKIVSIMKQLLSVVNMMHSQNIAHRSINPSHIMLQFCQNEYFVKLIDFGSCAYSYSPKLKPPRQYRTEKAYNSPQSESSPLKHDIYCCGLIFLSLLGGARLIKHIRGKQQQVILATLAEYPCFQNLQKLLKSMLRPKPSQRISALEILNHEIFTDTQAYASKDKIVLNNLRNFNIKGKLKTTLWMFATIKLQGLFNKIQLMNEFYCLDKNKDGKIQFEELQEGFMHTFGISEEVARQETEKIFKRIDKNNNGYLDFYEFVLGAYMVGKNLTDNELAVLFSEIDANKDGYISQEELNKAIEGIEQFQMLTEKGMLLDFRTFKQIMKSYFSKMSGNGQ